MNTYARSLQAALALLMMFCSALGNAQANVPPIANAGPDVQGAEGVFTQLDGSTSSDPEGLPLTYSWTQIAGPTAAIGNPNISILDIGVPSVGGAGGMLSFQLTVTDAGGLSSSDIANVVVVIRNLAPVAALVAPATVIEGARVTLDGSGSFDPNGDPITYVWSQIAGNPVQLDLTDPIRPTFIAPTTGTGATLRFLLSVSDGQLTASTLADITVTAVDHPPVANAGADQTVQADETVTLDGTLSSDPDGHALTYIWTQTSGPAVTLDLTNPAKPTFIAPAGTATISFSLVVNDGAQNSLVASEVSIFLFPNAITTFAGNGSAGFTGDNGPAIDASLNNPYAVAVDAGGNLYIADQSNYRVRKVTPARVISTVAGNGVPGFSGDGGLATSASIDSVQGLAVDGAGNVYIADAGNFRIRRVDAATGLITTVAGSGYGNGVFSGDGGPATSAVLIAFDVAVDSAGNLFIADTNFHRVRRVDAASGIITTMAGSGVYGFSGDGGPATDAALAHPISVAVDGAGNVYVSDVTNYNVRRIDAATGVINTVAGNGVLTFSGDGGPATNAGLSAYDVTTDAANNLYIADLVNSRIRRVDATTQFISTVAGNGVDGFSGDGGQAIDASLSGPVGVAVDNGGNIYIVDSNNQRIRRVAGRPITASDTSPPVIQPNVVGTIGANGWYTSNVGVNWTVTDAESAITSQTGCDPSTVTGDTSGVTFTCKATSAGGTTTQSISVKRDATAPVANATPSPMPNGNGWNSASVTVHFTGGDNTSGIASCSADVVIATEGAGQTSGTGTCVDNAGNVGSPVASNVNIDKTLPVVTASRSPGPNGAGWNNTPVAISFAATDTLSGVAAGGCTSPVTLSGDGAGQSATGQCADNASNVGSATLSGINVDGTPPALTASRSPAANGAGWNNSNVTVSFTCTDAVSGSGVASCPSPVVVSNQAANQSASGTGTDVAGNSSTTTVTGISIDRAAPIVTITTPPNGASYPAGTVVNASFSCADILSGTATCTGTVANGSRINTATVGGKTFVVNATDVAGNAAAARNGYTVTAPIVTFSLVPSSLAFNTETVNIASAAQVATLTNTGTIALPITSITRTGANANQFSQTNTCGASVAVNATCEISVVFRPTSAGAKAATLNVNAGGGAGTQTVSLTGTGIVATYTVGPNPLAFASQAVGVASAAQTVTVTNIGTLVVPVTSITLTGANAGQFSQTNTCGTSVAVGGTCTINVVFKPTTVGAKVATVNVNAGGGAGTQTVSLTGTGVVPTYSLAPPSLAFGNQPRNTSSPAQTITLTNTGTLALPITSIALATGNPNQFLQTNTCGMSVAVGSSCTISVVFKPTTTGVKTSTVKVTAAGGAGAQTVSVTGTGI